MKRVVLIISIGLNLLLAGAAVQVWRNHVAATSSSVAAEAPTLEGSLDDKVTVAPATTLETTVPTNRFHWRQLESENYFTYVANLRKVGCPEKTIHDIVVADVEKLYARKKASVPLRVGFWSSGSRRAAATRAQAVVQATLDREKGELLRQLLGADSGGYRNDHTDDLIEQAIMRFVIGPVSEDSLRKVFRAMARDEKSSDEISTRVQGVMLTDDDEAVARIHRETRIELIRALTPGQFEEFMARAAAMEFANHDLAYFRVTAGELRQIARIRADVFGLGDEKTFDLFKHTTKTDAQEEEFRAQLKTYLGESRFAEFERSTEPAYQGVIDLSAQFNLPATAAAKVYELKQLADAGREELEASPSLPDVERELKCRQLQESTQAAARRLLGDSAFDEYLRRSNGNWITNSVTLQKLSANVQ